jgi:hypothetical protein
MEQLRSRRARGGRLEENLLTSLAGEANRTSIEGDPVDSGGVVAGVATTSSGGNESDALAILDSYAFSEPLREQFRRGWRSLVEEGFEPLQRALTERVMAVLATSAAARSAGGSTTFPEARDLEAVGDHSAPPGSPVSSGGGDLVDDYEPARVLEDRRGALVPRHNIHVVHVPAPRGVLSASVWMELYRTVLLLLCSKSAPCAVKRALYEQIERQIGAFCANTILPDLERRIPRQNASVQPFFSSLNGVRETCSPMRDLDDARAERSTLRARRSRNSMDTQSSRVTQSKDSVGDSERDGFATGAQPMEEGSVQGIELMDVASDGASDATEETNDIGVDIAAIEELLHAFCAWWMAYQHLVQFVCKIFSYLDRHYTDKQNGPPPLEQLGRVLFRTKILDKMRDVLRMSILTLIARDRGGDIVDRALIHSAVVVFTTTDWISYYADEIETPYLTALQNHYEHESQRWLDECPFPEYMREAESALRQEIAIAQAVLHPSSVDRVKDAVENVILIAHQDKLLAMQDSGFAVLLSQRHLDDLRRVFWLYSGQWIQELCGQSVDGASGQLRSGANARAAMSQQSHQERALQPIAQQFARSIEREGAGLFERYNAFVAEVDSGSDSTARDDSDRTSARKRHADGSEKQELSSLASSSSEECVAATSTAGIGVGSDLELASSERTGMWLVRELVSLHETYRRILQVCFDGHDVFAQQLRMAFEAILNNPRDMNMIPELLALYVDRVIQGVYVVDAPDLDITVHLSIIVQLLEYIYNKDVFAELYRFYLCRRLIFDLSSSRDLEVVFVERLKATLGPLFTARLEGMLRDMRTSLAFRERFENWMAGQESGSELQSADADRERTNDHPPAFSVTLTTTSIWPAFPADTDLHLPPVLSTCLATFEHFYEQQTQHRQLRWVNVLGKGIVECTRAAFPHMTRYHRIELELNTYQLCILLLFEDTDAFTFEQLCNALNVTSPAVLELVKRCILSLCQKKHRLLIKCPAGQEVRATDVLQLNRHFDPSQRRLRLACLPQQVNREEHQVTRQTVQDDRTPLIEATIVRLMKAHKQQMYKELVTEIQSSLNAQFSPDMRFIKERIENLIAREYLERDAQDPTLLRYVA